VTRSTQARQSYLSANMQNGNVRFRQMLDGLTATLRSQGVSAAQATHQAYGRIEMMLQVQAAALAFKDVVATLALIVMCLVPLAFIMQRPPRNLKSVPPPH
jgi:MFS transporter, DHA2 family, multidrug resistance protein